MTLSTIPTEWTYSLNGGRDNAGKPYANFTYRIGDDPRWITHIAATADEAIAQALEQRA